ncbi:MAG: hypothetical protein H7A25_14855 [Leptospiraceae bacterium]|nr:hypothetical protein [Leptospiraceae bacterium]MCP5501181.1 hypothetical protein [Leptospiraceae bacterium]
MKRILQTLKILFLILFISFISWIITNRKHIASFPQIISAFYSKEFCSCYFVMKRSEENCHNHARQWVPISSFELNKEKREVIVSGLGVKTVATFQNPKIGCVLDKW